MNGAIRALPHSGRQGAAALQVAGRVAGLDWTAISRGLDDLGSSLTGPVLGPPECKTIAELYGDDRRFRSTIDMARYRFGQGQYRYFGRPLPELVAELRAAFWPHLLPIARAWARRLGQPAPLEQRPRAQSRGTTSAIAQGQGLVFTTRDRPVPSRRGWSAAPMRHGVSVLRSGRRHTLGLVFHDAR